MDYTHLRPFATTAQQRYIEAIEAEGSYRKAAKALGINRRTLEKAMSLLKKRAATKGVSPEHDMTHGAPDPFYVKGVSSYYGKDGELRGQWVKTNIDNERRYEVMREIVEGLAESVRGLAAPEPAPSVSDTDLLSVYPMGDPHFGLYAWAEEAGEDFDLDSAYRVTCAAIDQLVASAPPSYEGMLVNLGDYFHADDSTNKTPAHGNVLDVDTRFAKVAKVGVDAMIYCIRRLLQKHQRVRVWNLPGNHDPHSALWLSICLSAFFHNEPRVEIDSNPTTYKYYQFGKVLLGATHGHGAKANDLPLLMAADQAEAWGATEFRHWLLGHIHHWSGKEYPGVVVETFRTLAAKDAWHASKGYRSRRDQYCITYHKQFGEMQRSRCDFALLQESGSLSIA